MWSGLPDTALAAEAAGLTPGRALDIGCGEGADAVRIAAHGWDVTALDVSQIALQRAMRHARDAGVTPLAGLAVGVEILLLTWLDRADRETLAVHPRGDAARLVAGVFGTRSPDRPNPIGVTACGSWRSTGCGCA